MCKLQGDTVSEEDSVRFLSALEILRWGAEAFSVAQENWKAVTESRVLC